MYLCRGSMQLLLTCNRIPMQFRGWLRKQHVLQYSIKHTPWLRDSQVLSGNEPLNETQSLKEAELQVPRSA